MKGSKKMTKKKLTRAERLLAIQAFFLLNILLALSFIMAMIVFDIFPYRVFILFVFIVVSYFGGEHFFKELKKK